MLASKKAATGLSRRIDDFVDQLADHFPLRIVATAAVQEIQMSIHEFEVWGCHQVSFVLRNEVVKLPPKGVPVHGGVLPHRCLDQTVGHVSEGCLEAVPVRRGLC